MHIAISLYEWGAAGKRFLDGAHAPPSPCFQTGLPSFLALSARLSWMPVPGKWRMPIGRTAIIASLCLNGAAFRVLGPVGLEGDLWLLAIGRPLGGDEFGAFRRSAM